MYLTNSLCEKHISKRAFIFDKWSRLLKSISWDQQIELVFSSKDRLVCFRLMDSFSRSCQRHLQCKHNYSYCLDKMFSGFHFDQTTNFDYSYRHYQHASLISHGREKKRFFSYSSFFSFYSCIYFVSVEQVYKLLDTGEKSQTLFTLQTTRYSISTVENDTEKWRISTSPSLSQFWW
jgi:hypothetical protein